MPYSSCVSGYWILCRGPTLVLKKFPLDYQWHIKVSAVAVVWATFWHYVSVVGSVLFPWNIKIVAFGLLPSKPQGNQNWNWFWMPKWLIHSALWVEIMTWTSCLYNIFFISLSRLQARQQLSMPPCLSYSSTLCLSPFHQKSKTPFNYYIIIILST